MDQEKIALRPNNIGFPGQSAELQSDSQEAIRGKTLCEGCRQGEGLEDLDFATSATHCWDRWP
jgi:hypothetical protein